jgi:predicted transcriptional regulator of viral defense system
MANIISHYFHYQLTAKMRLNEFFSRNPVFTTNELKEFLAKNGSSNPWTRKALLAHHRKQGRLLPVRRGLYVVLPPGTTPVTYPVDPYLLAAKMTDDAVLAYHTALEFHGKAYSAYERFFYLTERRSLPLTFRSHQFHSVLLPKSLRTKRQASYGVDIRERIGVPVRVTSLERTLVDVLDRPDLGGGWEEIWRSLELVEFFDLDKAIEYALLLGNRTTVAKVGFYLEQHREALMVEDTHLQRLRNHRPRKPHYMVRGSRKPGHLVASWNLVIPNEILERSWAEVT